MDRGSDRDVVTSTIVTASIFPCGVVGWFSCSSVPIPAFSGLNKERKCLPPEFLFFCRKNMEGKEEAKELINNQNQKPGNGCTDSKFSILFFSLKPTRLDSTVWDTIFCLLKIVTSPFSVETELGFGIRRRRRKINYQALKKGMS